MIVGGRAEVTAAPTSEALRQLELRYRLACRCAGAYANAGFTVVYEDVIPGAYLSKVCALLSRWEPGVVVLAPCLDVVERRDRERGKTAYSGEWTPPQLASAFDETPAIGLWLDTSELSVAQTVERILAHPDLTRIGLPLASAP
jgi:hypothetical protein